ncbi:anhydro-N-acetylmuramic acid kinase [Pseudanabaena sp. PCC 6802]|uniref:anhydro-N-acetylmuramic acid kinase n=1 Tax=Pseudanabaena sp. PCC 6802 TaxID=118173 RepID=UPI00034CC86A|nr:anhydro-N-acetylmuramic acid kinase [Pseudanabaena sp. PCC 6802]
MQSPSIGIGLISGTSVDGIDAALVKIFDTEGALKVELLAGETIAYDPALRAEILAVCAEQPRTIAQICQLDDAIASAFATAALQLMQASQIQPDFIGSHGQTVFHRPPLTTGDRVRLGYSVQLGRGAVIANLTGLKTVSDFRTADIEAGGQGAPMVSILDWLLLKHPTKITCVQNIGGISNVTYLPAAAECDAVFGWDNGPGNVLMDMATQKLFGQSYDRGGQIAAQGKADPQLVTQWLSQDYFEIPPPKSTGRELFSPDYLDRCLADCDRKQLDGQDILATLTEFTAVAIAQSYQKFLPKLPDRVLICGGGSRNDYLRQRLKHHLAPAEVTDTTSVGLNADFKEAIAFAVLGYLKLQNRPGNLHRVTGASHPVVLGRVHG